MTDLFARARNYVATLPSAVSGEHGHDAAFRVAAVLVHGFALSEADAFPVMEEYNTRCVPPWSPKELEHKLRSAAEWTKYDTPRGHLAGVSGRAKAVQPAPRPRKSISFSWFKPDEPDESKATWIAAQLKVFFTEGLISAREDGAPDMDEACALAGWLKLSREAYEDRGVKTDDEEIRRTALACQFEHGGGRLPTMRAVLGFLSVRLLALRPIDAYVEGGALAASEGGDSGKVVKTGPVATGGDRTKSFSLPSVSSITDRTPRSYATIVGHCAPSPGIALDPCAIALDLETYSTSALGTGKAAANDEALTPHKGDVRLLSYCNGESPEPTVVDLLPGGVATQLPEGLVERLCGAELVIHNALFDLRFLRARLGISPKSVWCTLTASRLLDPGKPIHGLGAALERHLGVMVDKALARSDWAALMLTEGQLKYAADDVRYLLALRSRLAELLAAARLAHVFELEMRLILVVTRMEARGVRVDVERLRELRMSAAQVADPIAAQLRNGLGRPHLNLESPSQLVAAFNVAGIAIAGTDDDTLAARPEPLVQLLRAYRKPASLAGYAGMLLAAQREGRIHAAYSSTGTVNGRFTCELPNLQNVPRNREMRSCFVPSASDRRLIVADYGQIELRIAALIAEESVMIKAFRSGEDLHRAISAACLRKPAGDVTPEERKLGKAVNFGFLYGQGAEGFQVYARSQYGVEISLGEARRFRDEFFRAYPAIRRWHDNCWRRAKDGVDVERTVFGRIVQARPGKGAPEVTDWNRFNMLTEYRVCGSAADLLKVAMVRIDAAMPEDAHIVATVHDELILDVPVETAAFCLEMTKHEMELAFVEMFGTSVPVEVESKICANWGEKE